MMVELLISRHRHVFLLLFIVCSVITTVYGYGAYRDQIPNGNNVPHPCKPNYKWNGVGHKNVDGGGNRNPFGVDFAAANKEWTTDFCQKDSDGDGKSNGEELGDPKCEWTAGGVPSSTENLSHPGVCEPVDDVKCKEQSDWVNEACEYDTFDCTGIKEQGVKQMSFRFPPTPVPAKETTYMCMEFELDVSDDFHLIATEPIINNTNVMHHAVVFGCKDGIRDYLYNFTHECGMVASRKCSQILSIWTLGSSGECFHDQVGFRLGSNGYKRVALQFHWNNPGLVDNYIDESGMILYYTANKRENDAGILTIGADYLNIPPLTASTEQTSVCPGSCSKNFMIGTIYVVSAFNHMHYLGKSQKIELFRNGVKIQDITNDPVYNYDSPIIHELSPIIEVRPGDTLSTTCTFDSRSRNTTTYFGDATSAEMCYGFITYYPKENVDKEFCTAWETLPNCFLEGDLDEDTKFFYKGCNAYTFRRLGNVDGFNFTILSSTCIGGCPTECKAYLDTMFEHPCMIEEQLRSYLLQFWQMYKYNIITDLFKVCYPDGLPPLPTTITQSTTVASTKSVPTDPNESSSGDPSKVDLTDPTKSVPTDPTESSSGDPSKFDQTDPTKSVPTDPNESSSGDPSKVDQTDPTKSVPTDPTESSSGDPSKNDHTDPTKSASGDSVDVTDSTVAGNNASTISSVNDTKSTPESNTDGKNKTCVNRPTSITALIIIIGISLVFKL
ncbi:hypothetical protein LOTGIDRAFT_233329 [Lottia gigantea]|uniref:DOMON domain-containing protein n=1 Tax=Lottia gigantea TaxID=225164 RepID=V3ZL42_LOTGI|nr:hypothetical protein LOTGIDRAFT_233329 [Lottia gigantea]ESO92083.1 hypothetical protein LOTGIDRAFT_233329 [Lottia gigantea]